VSNHPNNASTQHRFVGSATVGQSSPERYNGAQGSPKFGRRNSGHFGQFNPQQVRSWQGKQCYRCRKWGHIARQCDQANEVVVDGSQVQVQTDTPVEITKAHVNTCVAVLDEYMTARSSIAAGEAVVVDTVCNAMNSPVNDLLLAENNSKWEFSQFPVAEAMCTTVDGRCDTIAFTPLKCVSLSVEGMPCLALIDSGAQIPVISQDLFEALALKSCGWVDLQGVIGEAVRSPLVKVTMKPRAGSGIDAVKDVSVTCAVAPLLYVNYCVILPTEIGMKFQPVPTVNVASVVVKNTVGDVNVDVRDDDQNNFVVNREDSVRSNNRFSVVHNSQLFSSNEEGGDEGTVTQSHDDPASDQCHLCDSYSASAVNCLRRFECVHNSLTARAVRAAPCDLSVVDVRYPSEAVNNNAVNINSQLMNEVSGCRQCSSVVTSTRSLPSINKSGQSLKGPPVMARMCQPVHTSGIQKPTTRCVCPL